jgi:glucose/arabinose dehydrogenase
VGRHALGSIIKGPGDRLFFVAGSTLDKGGVSGRVLSFAPGETKPAVEATGLNSVFGLAFAGRRLLVTDGGRNDLGPYRPRDELNAFDPSGGVVNFGFPRCYDKSSGSCAGTEPPLTSLAPHAVPVGVAVKGDVAYVAENGSSYPENPTGSDIQRVDLQTGRRTRFWRSPVEHDPTGAVIGPDGDLYVALYASGKIVRFDL